MTKETDISQLGKFGLINYLNKDIKFNHQSSISGIEEDAGVIRYEEGKSTVVGTSILLEGINFNLVYVPLRHLGYRAAIDAISKVVAMNAQAYQLMFNLAVSKRFSLEDIEELRSGFILAAQTYQADIIQIDITTSYTGLTISTTAIGCANKDQIVLRSGAKNTDLLCVSGDFGAAYMGLQLLEREKSIYTSQLQEGGENTSNFEPDFSGKEYILERQLKPEARKDIVQLLNEKSILPTAMIEVRDGLASSLIQLCKASQVGCKIYEEHIPIDYQTAIMAEEFNMNVTTVALNGGDDYELLFTVPLARYEDITSIEGVRLIGHITEEKFDKLLETRDGAEMTLKAQGFGA